MKFCDPKLIPFIVTSTPDDCGEFNAANWKETTGASHENVFIRVPTTADTVTISDLDAPTSPVGGSQRIAVCAVHTLVPQTFSPLEPAWMTAVGVVSPVPKLTPASVR